MKKLSVADKDYLLSTIRDVKDFPKPGILFKDITTLLNDKKAFKFLMDHLEDRYKDENLDFIVGIESRGFILGAALASKLDLPFVPVRKPHKLPYITISQKYSLEYGVDEIEMHVDAFRDLKDPRVLLVDDLIATGGTAIAACDLIANVGANLVEAWFLIDLLGLGGSKNLKTRYPIYSILEV
ncbi:adenine phosphoribosyltransferase [Campylobacter hyointestinalis subsp. hyointestinalis]|uniref:adenine phosphoribosyltransferase n=1 Tax=Campylobacter hyointestinalis TaxID=198 RepID=UPI000CE2EB57|nr:adenine phosphoribosyltransferase [Campylobacter hyointestinalis]PPB69924.1 adenine phosphoribosyltransferase [Campylobacter hyointestinalis subsp. hyointestinalis]